MNKLANEKLERDERIMEQSKEVGFCALNLPAKSSEVTADRRIHVALNSETFSDRPLVMGRWGIFEPQEFFSLSNSLYELILGRSMNIF